MNNINWKDGKLWAGLISLLIVLIQQVMLAFGFKYPVDWNAIAGIINTVLTILGMLGVVSDVTKVDVSSSPTPQAPKEVPNETK